MATRLITLQAMVDDNQCLTVHLPENIKVTSFELVIEPAPKFTPLSGEITRDVIRARLKAAGLLSEKKYAPPDAMPLSNEERAELGRLFAADRPIEDILDEERGL